MEASHDIRFDTGALEKIVYEPRWVLENEEEFWGSYPAQRYTRDWARAVNYEIDYGDWRRMINEWSRVPEDERRAGSLLKITETIVGARERFLHDAIPHLLDYLPETTVLDVGVYFTAFIPPRAFAMGEIVFNVAATYWKGNPDNILNTMVHEVFHAGYGTGAETTRIVAYRTRYYVTSTARAPPLTPPTPPGICSRRLMTRTSRCWRTLRR